MNLNDKFDKSIINKIVKDKIKPKSKWQFFLRDSVIWGVGVISLIVGSLSFAVVIYLLKYNDWSVYSQITDSLAEFILLTLPYFWLVFLVIFIFIVYYNIKHTKKGYRYSLPAVLVISIVASVMLGGLFFKVGLGQTIDDVLGEKAPFYTKLFNRKILYMSQPDKGRLSGMVVSRVSDSEFLLLDIKKHEWTIFCTGERALPPDIVVVSKPVSLVGEKISENIFQARRIIPIGPGRRYFMRHGDMHLPGLKDIDKMNNHMMNNPEFKERFKDFPEILEKYPELKESFLSDFPQRREKIQEMLKNDPELIKRLESLWLEPEIMEELLKE